MPLNENMEECESISVIDVYDIASDIGKEFEKIIDSHGPEIVTGLMPKVITALEHLEVLATKNEREDSNVDELKSKILQLENDKLGKAEDRVRYERELEVIEDHWRKEIQELESVVVTLQEENHKLKAILAAKQDIPGEQVSSSELDVDLALLQRLRGMVDELRDKVRNYERENSLQNSKIDELTADLSKVGRAYGEANRKVRVSQGQVKALVDDMAEYQMRLQSLQHQTAHLSAENARLSAGVAYSKAKCPECRRATEKDPDVPTFTETELKEVFRECNDLKVKVSSLEDELQSFRPKPEPESPGEEELSVQGPLPYEPDDAPWKKSESGIRKFFKKLFTESNVNFLGSSPKHSHSSLSKMSKTTLADAPA